MKKIITLIVVLVALLTLWSFITNTDKGKTDVSNQNQASTIIKNISIGDFKTRLATKEYTVIDVRTPQEIAEGKITQDALEIDFYAADFKDRVVALDKNKKYLLYCRSGNRTGQTLRLMQSLGFTEVYDLVGGKTTWDASL